MWTALCFAAVAAAFVLATAVPIFSDLIGIAASLFAAWYTYGLAGFFWLHDKYHLEGGAPQLKKHWFGTLLAVLTILAGAFICVAGTYVSVKVSSVHPYINVLLNRVDHVIPGAYLVDHRCIQEWSRWPAIYMLRKGTL